MRRGEALAMLAAGLAMLAAGLVWLFGPFGLIGVGLALLVVVLFLVDVKEG